MRLATDGQNDLEKELYILPCELGVEETIKRLVSILEEQKFPVYHVYNHAEEVAGEGVTLRPVQAVVFGLLSARAKALEQEPSLAAVLPLRIAVWEDAQGKVWLGFSRVSLLAERFSKAQAELAGHMQNLMENIAHRASKTASARHEEMIKNLE